MAMLLSELAKNVRKAATSAVSANRSATKRREKVKMRGLNYVSYIKPSNPRPKKLHQIVEKTTEGSRLGTGTGGTETETDIGPKEKGT
ncbi:hypothetical protein ES703_113020 [subsurface metagenome]